MENTKIMNTEEVKSGDTSGAVGIAVLGGILLLAGLLTFIARTWGDIDSVSRIVLVCAGVAVAHVAGYALTRARNYAYTGSIFHTVGMFLLPTAFAVYFTEMNSNLSGALEVFIAATAGALAYLPFAFATRRSIFTIFGVANALIAIAALANVVFGDVVLGDTMNYVYLILIMACGAIGYYIRPLVYPFGAQALLVLGAIGTAGFGFFMGAFNSFDFYGSGRYLQAWDMWYPLLMSGMVYVGAEIKSGVVRASGIVGIVCAALLLFAKYADDIGLSVIIAVVGVLLIALAYRMVQKSKEGK